MAIETAAYFRRLARSVVCLLLGALSVCCAATAQTVPAVTTGSVVPLQHATYNQIYKILYWQGNVLILDTAASVLYEIAPGSTTVTTLVSGPPLGPCGFCNEDMTIDNEGNLYIDERYPGGGADWLFLRVPYQNGTWAPTASDGWGANISTSSGTSLLSEGSDCIAFLDSGNGDGSGTLYWMTELSPYTIYEEQVDGSGNPSGPAVSVVTGLLADQGKMAIDANGDLYFIENPATSDSDRVNGLFFVPSGSTGLSGESSLTNLIPASYNSTNKFNGVTLDPVGNLYLTSESDSYGGTWDGVIMIPNTCGSQSAIFSPSCFNWDNASFIAPVGSNNPLMVDPRGFLWIPSYGSWAPDAGSGTFPGAKNFVIWQMGSANLGSSPVGQQGATGTMFVNFNQSESPGSVGFSQPGSGSDFVAVTTNPNPNSSATTPDVPCSANPTTPYTSLTFCQYWVALNPRTAGPISGQFVMKDGKGNVIPGSTTYLNGVGQAPMAALLGTPLQTAMASGLAAPAQVAVDTLGNVYVADPTLGKVLEYAAGSTAATGTSIGSGLKAPTGVAVDGSGDLYIADSGNIYEIPFVNGALNTAGQFTLFTANPPTNPLGNNVNLAVDGAGDLFAADPSNAQVIRFNNPQAIVTQYGYSTVAANTATGAPYQFKSPSAVAVDNSGDLFVADGSNLIEITPLGLQSTISSTLAEPVTGLAIDPAGDVDVSQAGGILHIPSLSGVLTVNDAIPLDTALTAPNSIAIDNQGNLYVADMTSGSPNVYQVSINGFYNWGQVGSYVPQEEDVDLYNIGNQPLALTATPTFSGADAGDFSITTPSETPCDTTGVTTVGTGGSCALGVQIDAQGVGTRTGTMAVTSTATNAGGSVTDGFTANAVNNLEPVTISVALNPTTTTFPGSTTATVTISPAPTSTTPANTNVPSGTVVLTLTPSAKGSTQPPVVETQQAAGTDTSTTAVFTLTGIPGGSYNVSAAFKGDTNFAGGTAQTTLTVAQATPVVTLSEPSGVTPDSINGVYYVPRGSTTSITVTVTSTLGEPTGSVNFMNGSQLADPTQTNLQLNAAGQATFSLQNLAAGTYSIIAVYGGDQNFADTPSSPITFQVVPPSILISASPASVSTTAGTPVASTLTLQSLAGFAAPGGVNITCDSTTLPKDSECTFNVPQPELCAPPGSTSNPCTGLTTTVVTLSTNIPVNVGSLQQDPSRGSPFVLAGVFGLGLLGLALRRRRLHSRYLLDAFTLVLLLGSAVMGFTGCTNSGYTKTPPAPHYVTPSGTYNVSIIATDEASGQQYSLPFTIAVTIK